MKYTTKDKQDKKYREMAQFYADDFAKQYPSRKIGVHHYIRKRHLEQFLYDIFILKLSDLKEDNKEII